MTSQETLLEYRSASQESRTLLRYEYLIQMNDTVHTHEKRNKAVHNSTVTDINRPQIISDLTEVVDGDVRFDEYSRQLYATDASSYEVTPIGVIMPKSTDDVSAVMSYCAAQEIAVLPRGGGTSLAGQAVNEAIVLDFSRYMDRILRIDPSDSTAHVEAGTILEKLNSRAAEFGLKFAPDPAAGDRSTVGGAIGNNSTGAHSLKYGKTDAYIDKVTAVLADGSVVTLGETTIEELREDADPGSDDILPQVYAELVRILDEEEDEIRKKYPNLKRNVSGYNLNTLVAEANGDWSETGESGTVNLARLLAGSEGTLATVTEATVSLEPVPADKAVTLLCYENVIDAVTDVQYVLEHDPAAVELIDDTLIQLAGDTAEFKPVVDRLPDGTEAALLVEFYTEGLSDGKRRVSGLVADRVPNAKPTGDVPIDYPETQNPTAFAAKEAYDKPDRKTIWKLRKAAAPILLSRTTDSKHISFIEDCAIPAEQLPNFVSRFQELLEEHNTFATFYAHAGPGVLHIRPLVDTKTEPGRDTILAIADAVTDMVVEYNGSVSGEHGDGRARTQWNRKLYGDRLWYTFRDLKTAFDPSWLLNPGPVCGDVKLTEDLRFGADYEFDSEFEPTLNWDNDNGFQGMAELCHGCGGCRGDQETTGGVMCPTYRAADEEITSTRGRANMLRQAMSGELSEDEQFSGEFVTEVLDLCIGCKGCARDCPSEVDMAKLKAELVHEYHQREGASLRDRIFADIEPLARIGSKTAPISNWMPNLPGVRTLLEKTVGITSERDLPQFYRESFVDWMSDRTPSISYEEADRSVILFPDTYTNYSAPDVGKAAVRVLEHAGVHVRIPDTARDSGRPAFSKGFLDKARDRARKNVAELAPLVQDGWDVVVIEPSDAVMIQSDYLDLLSGNDVEVVSGNTYGVMEYFDFHDLDVPAVESDQQVTYHGHCHQTAVKREHHAPAVLQRAGYDMDVLDSGCCGMAGSFGYEAEHRSMSEAIASILFEQVDNSCGELVTAPGTSCRTQLSDHVEENPPHPVELLDPECE